MHRFAPHVRAALTSEAVHGAVHGQELLDAGKVLLLWLLLLSIKLTTDTRTIHPHLAADIRPHQKTPKQDVIRCI